MLYILLLCVNDDSHDELYYTALPCFLSHSWDPLVSLSVIGSLSSFVLCWCKLLSFIYSSDSSHQHAASSHQPSTSCCDGAIGYYLQILSLWCESWRSHLFVFIKSYFVCLPSFVNSVSPLLLSIWIFSILYHIHSHTSYNNTTLCNSWKFIYLK